MTESCGLGSSSRPDFGVGPAMGAETGSALALVVHLAIHLSRTSIGQLPQGTRGGHYE